MKWKKILVVYYSRTGNTKKLAKDIALKLNGDLEEIKTPISYSGFFGYQRALFHALLNKTPEIIPSKRNPLDYDLVVIGGPIWGSSISAPIRSFLTHHKDNLSNVAFFSTQVGKFGQKNLIRQMKQVCGRNPQASLSVTERELHDGTFMVSALSFLSKLKNGHLRNGRRKTARVRQRDHYMEAQTQH